MKDCKILRFFLLDIFSALTENRWSYSENLENVYMQKKKQLEKQYFSARNVYNVYFYPELEKKKKKNEKVCRLAHLYCISTKSNKHESLISRRKKPSMLFRGDHPTKPEDTLYKVTKYSLSFRF